MNTNVLFNKLQQSTRIFFYQSAQYIFTLLTR